MKRNRAALGLAVLLTVGSLSHAATLNWNGATSALWSDPTNWNQGVIPENGDDLVFGTTTGTRTMTNDLSDLVLNTLTFPGNAYVLSGNPVTITTEVAITAGGNNAATLSALLIPQSTMVFNAVGGRLQLDGDVQTSNGIRKTGVGTLRIQGSAKTYGGDTVIEAGSLDLLGGGLPFGPGKGNVIVEAGANFNLNNFNTNINALRNGTTGAGTLTKTGSNTRTLTLGNGDASGSFTGNVSFTGGSSSITKVGLGTQVLGGNGTVGGVLTVSAGQLILDGTWNQGVTVAAAGALGGTGALAGTTTVNGILAPGGNLNNDTTAVLDVASLVLNASSTTRLQIAGTVREASYDGVNVSTALTYGGILSLDLSSATQAGVYDLFNFGSVTPAGAFSAVHVTGVVAGSLTNNSGEWSGTLGAYVLNFSPSTGDLTVAVIPEPGALALLLPAGLLMTRRRTR